MAWDVFISHASEDKAAVARPLKDALTTAGLSVWYDADQIKLGGSLLQAINNGLAQSRYGVVVLSPAFFRKQWTQKELGALMAFDTAGLENRILPVIYDMGFAHVRHLAPILADVLSAKWDDGIESVAGQIVRVVLGRPVVPGSEPGTNPHPTPLRRPAVDLELLAAAQAAQMTSVGRSTWWGLHASGRCPLPVRLGGRTLWRAAELWAWIAAGCPPRTKWTFGRP